MEPQNTQNTQMDIGEDRINLLSKRIIGCALIVLHALGTGFLEKVYENALMHELRKSGLAVSQQHLMVVRYDGIVVGEYAVDLLVEHIVLVELKVVKAIDEVHRAQCLNYLKATGLHLCLLLNFGKPRLEIKRIVLALQSTAALCVFCVICGFILLSVGQTAYRQFAAVLRDRQVTVAGLTRGLAADHSAEGIRVNAVGPGPIFTPFHARRIAAAGETVEQYNARAAQGTMLKRPGRAEEVAAAILFLASDDASYVTGALLFVDGGMTAL